MDIMEITKYDIKGAYWATGAVTECGPYEHDIAQGAKEWLEPTASQPDMNRGWKWIQYW